MAEDDRNVADALTARRRAAESGHTGDEATARSLLHHADAGIRATALAALDRMHRLTGADVRAALDDASPSVRRRALKTAITTKVEIEHLLRDVDATVAEQAAWALGEREDASAVVALIGAAAHADALVREAAVAALGAIGAEEGLATILAATEDKPAIRRRAVLALSAFEGPAVQDALQRALTDNDWQVRESAEVVLEAQRDD